MSATDPAAGSADGLAASDARRRAGRAALPAPAERPFRLSSRYRPAGDQPEAIEALVAGDAAKRRHQVLLGVTGSGKTFTIANVIARLGRPTLILAPNKTLAAQLFDEFRELFPENAVEYFVSFYDYYQPEAYLPSADLFIEKDSSINDRIDRMRHSATRSVLTRRDTIVVASVSCIYALGSPSEYAAMHVALRRGERVDRDEVIRRLVKIQYRREDFERGRGTFRARGDVLEVGPADRDDRVVRVEWFGDEIDRMEEVDPLTGEVLRAVPEAAFYPSSHYVTREDELRRAVERIEAELEERIRFFRYAKKPVEADRIARRTRYDLELLRETGFCPGIENYSRHLDGRGPGEAAVDPPRLLPRRLPPRRGREPRDDPAGGGDVPRRPRAQGDARRVRVPPALRARQPPAALRGVRGADPADDLRVGHAGALGEGEGRRDLRGAGDPPDGPRGPAGVGQARAPPGGRRARTRSASARRRRSACS